MTEDEQREGILERCGAYWTSLILTQFICNGDTNHVEERRVEQEGRQGCELGEDKEDMIKCRNRVRERRKCVDEGKYVQYC